MNDKTITVMTPVYNMGKYLDLCILSILKQTYENFILLLIDDGSSDISSALCDRYAAIDPRVVVIHTVNQGQGEARNTALKFIVTPYVAMVDSDDCVNIRFLEHLINAMDETGADIVCPSFLDFQDENEIDIEEKIDISGKNVVCYSRDQAIKELCLNYRPNIVTPQKLYKSKVLFNIRYAKIGVNIDEWVIHRLMLNCEKFAVLDKKIYYYRKSAEGMTRNFSAKKISGVQALIDRINCLESAGYSEYLPALYSKLHDLAILFYSRCKTNGINGAKLLKPYKKYLIKAFSIGIKHRKDLYCRREMILHWSFGVNFALYGILSKVIK